MARRRRPRANPGGPTNEAIVGAVALGTIGYLAAEGIIDRNAHPLHWLAAGVAGVIGYWAGKGLSWWKQR